MRTFEGKTAWIVGASSGIGASVAIALARDGARCILSARRTDRLKEVLARCPHPERHRILELDIAETATLGPAAASAGPIDLLVLSSGISQRGATLETDLSVDRRIMEVNFFGTIELARIVTRTMVQQGGGRIVVISSVMGKLGTPRRSAYAASKHALHGWFESLRAEQHSSGVGCTLVCAGYVRTEISLHALAADGSPHARMDRVQAEGMDPDECARRILRAVRRGRDELYVGGREILGIYLARFAPGVLRRIVRGRTPE